MVVGTRKQKGEASFETLSSRIISGGPSKGDLREESQYSLFGSNLVGMGLPLS